MSLFLVIKMNLIVTLMKNKIRIYYPLERRNIRYKTKERITTSIMGYQSVNGWLFKINLTTIFINFF